MNATQSAILRALELCRVLDVEHTGPEVHAALRAVRHELRTLRDLQVPEATDAAPELASARTGRGTQPGSQRHHIMGVLAVAPAADFQVANHLRLDVAIVRKRRHELLAAGWVERAPSTTGGAFAKRVQEATGRECTVYQLTTAGLKALARLRSGQVALFTDDELGNELDTKPDKARASDVVATYEPCGDYL